MTSIYISSTYADLIKYREAVTHILRKMSVIAVSMEDYTASDERPLDKCLADVARCDIYIGIFAFRYGFVPQDDNPEKASITELEYLTARRLKKPCLIFLAEEATPWLLTDTDAFTKQGEQGNKIKALRDRLSADHIRNAFRGPDDLAASVSSAVANLLQRQKGIDTNPLAASSAPQWSISPREISSDLFLAYSDIDRPYAEELATYLNSNRLRIVHAPGAFFSETAEDFLRMEKSLRSCHAAAVLISAASLIQMDERRESTTKIIRMIEARTSNLFAVCLSEESAAEMRAWPIGNIECVAGWHPREASPPRSLHERIELLRLSSGLDSRRTWTGLPIIVVAMTGQEATELDVNPAIVLEELGRGAYDNFSKLRVSLAEASKLNSNKYGASRLDWRPFVGRNANIRSALTAFVEKLNYDAPFELRGKSIKLQSYSIDDLVDSRSAMSPIFTQLSSTGCLVIIDEYSLFHPAIHKALVSSGLLGSDQVSLVTISPSNPYSTSPFDVLENELSSRMAAAFDRFSASYDPKCELSIGDEKRLNRWLNAGLPQTVQNLRHPRPNRQNISLFSSELAIDPQTAIASLLYSPGGML